MTFRLRRLGLQTLNVSTWWIISRVPCFVSPNNWNPYYLNNQHRDAISEGILFLNIYSVHAVFVCCCYNYYGKITINNVFSIQNGSLSHWIHIHNCLIITISIIGSPHFALNIVKFNLNLLLFVRLLFLVRMTFNN